MKPRKSLFLLVPPMLLTGCSTAQSELSSVDALAGIQSSLESSLSASDFEEQVLYDSNDIKVIASSLVNINSMPTLEITIENDSDDDIRVCTPNLSINDCMLYTNYGLFLNVHPGETISEGMRIPTQLMPVDSSNEIGKIEFSLEIFEGEQENEEHMPLIDKTPVSIFLKEVDSPAQPEGEIILDQNGIRVISTGMTFNANGAMIGLYIENTTDHPILFSGTDLIVNGISISSGYLKCFVEPGKKAFPGIPMDASVLVDNGKDLLESADFNVKVCDADNYDNVFASSEVHLDLQK